MSAIKKYIHYYWFYVVIAGGISLFFSFMPMQIDLPFWSFWADAVRQHGMNEVYNPKITYIAYGPGAVLFISAFDAIPRLLGMPFNSLWFILLKWTFIGAHFLTAYIILKWARERYGKTGDILAGVYLINPFSLLSAGLWG